MCFPFSSQSSNEVNEVDPNLLREKEEKEEDSITTVFATTNRVFRLNWNQSIATIFQGMECARKRHCW